MTYYLVETLNRKTGEIISSCPIEVPNEVLRNWFTPYQEHLIKTITEQLEMRKKDDQIVKYDHSE